jgi:hypothetical protein
LKNRQVERLTMETTINLSTVKPFGKMKDWSDH